mgnify:CR=1 FL=1
MRGNISIDLSGPGGNAFALLGTTRKLLRELGRGSEAYAITQEMMSGDYDNLLSVMKRELPFINFER